MAEVKKNSSIKAVFLKEYKYEGLILLILAIIAITLGTVIVSGSLTIDKNVFLIGKYPKVFSWALIILGTFSLILSVIPYYKPSIEEVKRVTWPSKRLLFSNLLSVFVFVIVLIGFFALANAALQPLTTWLDSLK